jgi:hypothetical protein
MGNWRDELAVIRALPLSLGTSAMSGRDRMQFRDDVVVGRKPDWRLLTTPRT